MKTPISRRDLMKLAGIFSLGSMGMPYLKTIQADYQTDQKHQNILVIVFDAFSARHISMYGYDRPTTPKLTELANRAIVYHNHYSGGNFTTPGTASLLTGTLPWTHRALGFFDRVSPLYANKSLFHAFNDYYRVAYTHNPLAAVLLSQFSTSIEQYIPVEQFLLVNDELVQAIFSRDFDTASVGWSRAMKKEEGSSYSLFLSMIYEKIQDDKMKAYKSEFPHGMPRIRGDNFFKLETVMDWLGTNIDKFPRPYLGYFHFIPPHEPYSAPVEFNDLFLHDKFRPVKKPYDIFTRGASQELMLKRERQYDEYILYVDREFQKLFSRLEESGLLEDTWVILTSDHGELFERGIVGHVTPTLYEPVIRVPLMIFEPGRTTRLDIHAKTSVTDVLPTLLQLAGKDGPSWTEGIVLPPFSSTQNLLDRSIYTVQSKDTDPSSPLKQVTVNLVRGDHKLMYFAGYPEIAEGERIELYNLVDDPNELRNIYTPGSAIGKMMVAEIKFQLSEKNKNYS